MNHDGPLLATDGALVVTRSGSLGGRMNVEQTTLDGPDFSEGVALSSITASKGRKLAVAVVHRDLERASRGSRI